MDPLDMKMPNNIKYYKPQKIEGEDQGDFFQLISLVLGIISFIMKIKWACWLSMIFLLSSYVNTKFNSDKKQLFMNFSLIIMAFVMVYMPQRAPPVIPSN